ncbi:MAG: T9SS type A sorting domain-containing protein [bacterium]|jgi:hypothetical protein
MKKLTTILMVLGFAIASMAQVPRNYVVVEIATGTWCVYCPGAAMGADDLVAYGHSVAIVENHNGDDYAHEDSDARNAYYAVTGYPTANFDGEFDDYVGGSNTESMYEEYAAIVDNRIFMPSTHVMKIYGSSSGDEYAVTVRIQKQAAYEGDNLKVRLALTESHIPEEWFDMDEVNFVNRLMAPDADGIDISDINDYDVHDVEFTFDFDNSWDKTECELVAFIQDDDSKIILQSIKVELLDLDPAPPMISAVFSSSESEFCENGTADYEPDILGTGYDHTWSFPGGSPSSSTEETPSIDYNDLGDFDVSLIVTDGLFIDTNYLENLVSVVPQIEKPETPEGEDEICSGYVYNYEIPELDYAFEYEWTLSDEEAGSLSWDMNDATFEPSGDWAGNFTIKVRASNTCGYSEWSDEFSVTLSTSPEEFDLSGGGVYCEDEEGLELTLSGSETGVEYQLYLDSDPLGDPIQGTGSGISFGLQTEEGYYTVEGTTGTCSMQMSGQEEIYIIYAPLPAATPDGPAGVCNNETTAYTTEGASEADYYVWQIFPEEAGTIDGTETTATVVWNDDFEGEAEITVAGINSCGEGDFSEEFVVSVEAVPSPYVNGESLVCNDHTEMYDAEYHEGSTYTWEVTGGTITEGQGTYQVTVAWAEPGDGTVLVSEETANGCPGSSSTFPVTIDDCTGIGDNVSTDISIHPNPANDFVNIQTGSKLRTVSLFSLTGEMVINQEVNGNEYQLNTSALPAGLYLIKIDTEEGVVSQRLIIE